MKFKLIVDIDGTENKCIGTKVSDTKFMYREKAGQETFVEFGSDYVKITKTGVVNLECTHRVDEEIILEYKVSQGDDYFVGSSKIITKEVAISSNEIKIYYIRDGEEVSIKYKMS